MKNKLWIYGLWLIVVINLIGWGVVWPRPSNEPTHSPAVVVQAHGAESLFFVGDIAPNIYDEYTHIPLMATQDVRINRLRVLFYAQSEKPFAVKEVKQVSLKAGEWKEILLGVISNKAPTTKIVLTIDF